MAQTIVGVDIGADAIRVVRFARDALTYPEAPAPVDGWHELRLLAPVPRAARAVAFSLGLADGNVDGTVIHFAPPTLSVAPIR